MQVGHQRRLTLETRTLIEEVEDATGVEIGVKVESGRKTMGVNIDEFGATILFPSEDYFPDGAVVHETLHVRRILAEGVPRLWENEEAEDENLALPRALQDLDNSLEHLVIVPEVLRRHPERRQYWERKFERVWGHDIPGTYIPEDQRRHALLHWVSINHLVPGAPVIELAEARLSKLGLIEEAWQAMAVMIPALGSKEVLVRVTFEQMHLPGDIAHFKYFDARARVTRAAPIFEP